MNPQMIRLIPELNFWMRRILSNASVYDTFHKIPVEVDDVWREPRSVIEMLFNENFDPPQLSSSSSSMWGNIEDDNDKPYIYLYRKVNLLNITDKVVLNRIQPYRWWAGVYAANSNKFIDMFNMQHSIEDPTLWTKNDVVLPFDVSEEDRSPYITYESWNGSISNYPLWQVDHDRIIPQPEQPPIISDGDIFDFTDLTFDMLDKLYDYRLEYPVTLDDIDYSELDSCLSKLIYIYLDAFINESFEHYDLENPISDGSDILCTLYEKYVLDMVYLLRSKLYGIIWKDTETINENIYQIAENFFIILKKVLERRRVDDQVLSDGYFTLTGRTIPWNRKDFTLFKDGLILEQDQDFTITMDISDPNDVFAKVILLRDDFYPNELLEFIWSYADPYSAFSEDDN